MFAYKHSKAYEKIRSASGWIFSPCLGDKAKALGRVVIVGDTAVDYIECNIPLHGYFADEFFAVDIVGEEPHRLRRDRLLTIEGLKIAPAFYSIDDLQMSHPKTALIEGRPLDMPGMIVVRMPW